jgi:hypothetical protein
LKHLTVPNETVTCRNKKTKTETKHSVNLNASLNNPLVETALKLGAIKAGKFVVLDFDNHIIECEKMGSQYTYEMNRRYIPHPSSTMRRALRAATASMSSSAAARTCPQNAGVKSPW